MSSALHSATPPQPKQWWPRPPSSRPAATLSYRPQKTSASAAPSQSAPKVAQAYDEKASKPTSSKAKFNTFASAMGFKSRKNPTIEIPPGPASPPLPLQKPPPTRPPRPRHQTSSPTSSYYNDQRSPIDPSIYTVPSSEEAFEPLTPSDLSRHRGSYQPSLFTFAEQQDHHAAGGLPDSLGTRYLSSPIDARRISVMSDPSIIDPHLKREYAIRSSQISASSYYSPVSDSKTFPRRAPNPQLSQAIASERRKSSFEGRPSRDFDSTFTSGTSDASRRKSAELRARDHHRLSDAGTPAVPKMTASMLMYAQGPRKSPSALTAPGSKTNSRTASPAPSVGAVASESGKARSVRAGEVQQGSAGRKEDEERDERKGGDNITGLRVQASPISHLEEPSSARLSPALSPKASSVWSTSGSSVGGSARPSPSINTSFSSSTMSLSRNPSSASGPYSAGGALGNSVRRQPSSSRLRAVPPSRTPPPTVDLPPTPASARTPSPLTFRSPRNGSSASLLNSALSVASDDPSILTFDLPPSPSSESASSVSLCFAQPGLGSTPGSGRSAVSPREREPERGAFSAMKNGLRDARERARIQAQGSPYAARSHRPTTQPSDGSKSSVSTAHGMIHGRGDTPTPRSLKKSLSQSSITASLTFGGSGSTRKRVDSSTSAASSNVTDESASMFGSVGKSLRKPRSMGNTRPPGGLHIPPMPQQLRHANSFNTSAVLDGASGNGHVQYKDESLGSRSGSHRKSGTSTTPPSTSNSAVSTPTTPHSQKKRTLFSSHRERRDSNNQAERERQEVASVLRSNDASQPSDRKKVHNSHPSGRHMPLGLFTGHFSPGAYTQVNGHNHEPYGSPVSPPPVENSRHPFVPKSPERTAPSSPPQGIIQHILPPKELLSQMEALADTEAPSSPPQFADTGESEVDDEWSWDGSSIAEKQSMRSRVGSISGVSVTFGPTIDIGSAKLSTDSSPSPASTTRHFIGASGSIQGRLNNERPSTASRLPMRSVSVVGKDSPASRNRPSTAQALNGFRSSSEQLSPLRRTFSVSSDSPSESDFAPTGLPPPPRRKGAAISYPVQDRYCSDEPPPNPLSPPPATHSLHRLQRLPSHETVSSYNPNRGSIFRKPSFLNIDDDFAEAMGSAMSSVPEDSFLILERGKESLDIGRFSEDGL